MTDLHSGICFIYFRTQNISKHKITSNSLRKYILFDNLTLNDDQNSRYRVTSSFEAMVVLHRAEKCLNKIFF